ncbi:MAG: class A beta-lactamase [Pseudomonadota bacterium]
MRRREVVLALGAAALAACGSGRRVEDDLRERLTSLEARTGGRLGVGMLQTDTGTVVHHRGDERFAMCSTFKLSLAALVLREAEFGNLSLDTFIAYTEADMVPYAPVTTENLDAGGMTVGALAEAAQKNSDNVAANLLIRELGGPAGFTEKLRATGDDTTRLDRYEPEMNLVPPGEVRDTTTPNAMASTVAGFVTGATLSTDNAALLRRWMEDTRTGLRRIRGGLPEGLPAGDKTGTGVGMGMANKYNDVAVVWPSDRGPLVIAGYFEADREYDSIRPEDEAVLEEIGRIATEWLSEG